MYGKPIDSLVAARYSCRNYDRAPLGRKDRDALEAFIAAHPERSDALRTEQPQNM